MDAVVSEFRLLRAPPPTRRHLAGLSNGICRLNDAIHTKQQQGLRYGTDYGTGNFDARSDVIDTALAEECSIDLSSTIRLALEGDLLGL